MHFETIFFFAENDFFKPTHPTKVRKIPHFFFFETFPKPTLQTSVCYKQNQMINEILTELYLGHDMNACDYDKRTALHLAVAENHYNCVKYLVHTCKVEIHVKDR